MTTTIKYQQRSWKNILALSSGKIDKCQFLTGKEINHLLKTE